MDRIRRLLLIVFVEHVPTALLERGVFFYLDDQFAFTSVQRLLLMLAFGVVYTIAALTSHRVVGRMTEKRALVTLIVALLSLHALMVLCAMVGGPMALNLLVVAAVAISACQGMKWPIVESYISAGRDPKSQARAIGGFNITWSATVPLALVIAGPMIDIWPPLIFALSAGLNMVTLVLLRPLEGQPVHLDVDHPARLTRAQVESYRAQLHSTRWLMMVSYAMLFVIAPLMPDIFKHRLGYDVTTATGLSGVSDLMRVAAFVTMQRWAGWHGRRGVIYLTLLGLPAGFFMIIAGQDTATVVIGEVIFGIVAGMTYYAALYYGMVVHDSSVEGGGAHEGLIGLGFTLGPICGLLGTALTNAWSSALLGMAVGVAPLLVLGLVGGIHPLLKAPRRGPVAEQAPEDPMTADEELLDP